MQNNEPKGWNPEGTYTGRLKESPEQKWDNQPSRNPYPKAMPDPEKQPDTVLHIVKIMRRYEHRIHEDVIKFRAGAREILKTLPEVIRGYQAIKEEMTTGVYILPDELKWFLDNDGKEEAYA